jgi:hypothetical protein
MTFWQTVLAVVLGSAMYNLACLIFLGRDDDDDKEDPDAIA